uniref:Uncharacterized protein n=1 Tax=Anopheles braziliensis TaxID=58242 RepID=A0A2M3ZM06_9DIPT
MPLVRVSTLCASRRLAATATAAAAAAAAYNVWIVEAEGKKVLLGREGLTHPHSFRPKTTGATAQVSDARTPSFPSFD